MDRVALFIDAGYLFAQGSAALCGSKRARAELVLDAQAAINCLKKITDEKAADSKLLRIYWYDGAISAPRPTADQAQLAHMDNVKLRLGFVNSAGQQKGVDSLIVTDLIELARLGSLSDAILLSGDEDVRVGVQIAQNYGVRIHLLGIIPSRGSQSQQLLQECDTTAEWDKVTIQEFLSLREVQTKSSVVTENENLLDAPVQTNLESEVSKYVSGLNDSDVTNINAYWETERGVPQEHDRILLPRCRDVLGRDLNQEEKRKVRGCFRQLVKKRFEEK